MILLNSTSDAVRVVTSAAANAINCHASWMDLHGSTVTPGRLNTVITTATTTSIVPAPGAGATRNLKGLYISNDSASTSCSVSVRHFDGTHQVELIEVLLLPGENLGYNGDGSWAHRDRLGAEYPPLGLGAYTGTAVAFMKNGTAPDAVGVWYCTSKDPGFPGAWSPGTPGINGRNAIGSQPADFGCVPIRNADAGGNFLTEVRMAASVNHTHMFFDCLWVNSGLNVTTTTAQAIVTPTLPARDAGGTTNGEGCMIAMLVTTANTNAAAIANTTVSYTNSNGVSGRTATLVAIAGSQIPATPVIGTIIWFSLQAGDTGVRSIQSITLGTSLVAGAVSLMICRTIATIGTTIANVSAQKVIGDPGIRLYNDTCMLHCILASAATATFFSGELTIMEK